MPLCEAACPREIEPYDPESAGTIEDDETICRGAFEANYYKEGYKDGSGVKPNLIQEGRLKNGQLSVYRVSDKANFSIQQVAEQLTITHSQPIEIFCAQAADIRSLQLEWMPHHRLFCLVDETEIDEAGNKHPAHAHILVCNSLLNGGLEDVDITSLRDKLYLLFKKTVGWPVAA